MKMKMTATLMVTLAVLTGCENDRKDAASDRESRLYQSAMNDYNAGRLKEATAAFRKVCLREPANASARFQLACLLQDSAKDFYGALFAYHEYLNQRPESDRSHVAKDRMAMCEKEVARELAVKYGLTKQDAFAREAESARAAAATAEKTSLKLREDLMQAMQRIAALDKENDRLKAALRDDGAGVSATEMSKQVQSARALLDNEEAAVSPHFENVVSEARKEVPDATAGDRITHAADIAQLRLEGDAERALTGSALLPAQPADARARRDDAAAAAARERAERKRETEPLHETRPPTYVIVEGDTLYKIALRFYGRKSAWKMIRDANKAKISVDGRVKVGDTIRLP